MAATVLTNVQLLLGSYDVSAYSAGFDIGGESEMKEATTFASLGYTVVLPGLFKAMASINGFTDFATAAVGQTYRVAQVGTQQALSIIPTGTAAAAGDTVQFMQGRLDKLVTNGGNVGDVATFSVSLSGDSADVDGYVGVPLGARSSLTGTAVQVGATLATERIWAALHVTAAVGTNLAVTVTSDNASGFPSPATVLTFATTSAVGWQFISAAGPFTDDWLKVAATSTGSFTYAVMFGVM
jgi:hypothetical protein